MLKRADEREIEMETPEAREIATKEIMFMMGEEEKERVRKEMMDDAKNIEEDQAREQRESHALTIKYKYMDEKYAACLILKTYQRWRARKILFEKCSEVFEKVFDTRHKAFYYMNRRTVRKER